MTDRVNQFLLEQGHITREQYDKARRTKEFFGGPLDAHLLKLGFIQEDALGAALAALTGCPYAGPGHLRLVDPMIAALLPVELVEQHRVCPFAVNDGVLSVAMLNPRDAVAIGKIESVSRLTVEAWVTSEYRMNLALERHYRVRQRHYKALSLGPESSTDRALIEAEDEQTAVAGEAAEGSWDTGVGLDGRPLDAELTADEFAIIGTPARFDDETTEPPPEQPAPTAPVQAADILEKTGGRLVSASSVQEINAALMDYCSGKVSRCAVFAVSGEGFKCTAGRGRILSSEPIAQVTIPGGNGHLFDEAAGSDRSFYLGAVPPSPANRDLYSLLGGNLPPAAMILPLKVRTRVVALLYLDNDSDPIGDPDIPTMRRLAAKAGMAFELLLLRRKLEQF
jgi:hypothetical protein